MKAAIWTTAVVVGVSLCAAARADAQGKVFISADMEGVAGAVTGDQLGPQGFEYQRFREFMTDEVLAAIAGARAAGATEFLVADSHGNGENLLIERFPEDVQIVRSWPRPQGMMEGLDDSFAAAIFIGYHASTTNPKGIRAHTFSSATLTDVKLNGTSVTEGAFSAAIAGHFGVPVVMVSGDDAAVEEVQQLVGAIEGAVVKWHYSFHAARTLTPAAAVERIRAAAERGVRRAAEMTPYRLTAPVTLQVSFKHYQPPQLLAYLSAVQQVDSHTIAFEGRDILEVSRFMQFVTSYSASLTP